MKTIEEAAKELAEKNYHHEQTISTDIKHACQEMAQFTQRWISVEESMPEDHKELLLDKKGSELQITKPVLLKYKNGRYAIDCRRNAGDSYNFWKIDHSGITHWRPIEFK